MSRNENDEKKLENLKEGLYESLFNQMLIELKKQNESNFLFQVQDIGEDDHSQFISNYFANVFHKALNHIIEKKSHKKTDKSLKKLTEQIKICNKFIEKLSNITGDQYYNNYLLNHEGKLLTGIYPKPISKKKTIKRPQTHLSENFLFTGTSHGEPRLYNELQKEIITADNIDLLVSFVRKSGINLLYEALREFTKSPHHKLRLITTVYVGATEAEAIKKLSDLPNTEIKISYDTNRTRLHAKVYIFERKTGFGTAYIGSSNISKSAMDKGLEWNVKICEHDSSDIYIKAKSTFESYWNDLEYKLFSCQDFDDLKRAINHAKIGDKLSLGLENLPKRFLPEIKPFTYQEEILQKLENERLIRKNCRNLVVAATGTGKTVIAAFDYRNICEHINTDNLYSEIFKTKKLRLLFIVHRKEILEQTIDCFRMVLGNENFGDLWVGEYKEPENKDHLFISIQTLSRFGVENLSKPDYYDFIIIDECHHSAAKTYAKIIEYFNPRILLGLTATPERMDGKNIANLYFNGKISAELRLTKAISRRLLSPFHYFMVSDPVDLSRLKWVGKKGYDDHQLQKLYLDDKNFSRRATVITDAIFKYAPPFNEIKGIAFCAGVEHARRMAELFTEQGLKSFSLHGKSDPTLRNEIQLKLKHGEIKFICVADLYNEGVDIPDVNTVLFLRPTKSLTIFLQQLGRGLRLAKNKECLIVLDFVAQANEKFSFSSRLRHLINRTKKSIKHEVENDFPDVPPGCYIQMEKMAQTYILENIRNQIMDATNLKRLLKSFTGDFDADLSPENFMRLYDVDIHDFYKIGRSNAGWNQLCAKAGLIDPIEVSNPNYQQIIKSIGKLISCNDIDFLNFILELIERSDLFDDSIFEKYSITQKRMFCMFYYTLFQKKPEKQTILNVQNQNLSYAEKFVSILRKNTLLTSEIRFVINYAKSKIEIKSYEFSENLDVPLKIHCNYTRDQIMAAFGLKKMNYARLSTSGVEHIKELDTSLLFVTLDKKEKDFTPETMYHDYSLGEKRFHWQTQYSTDLNGDVAQRFFNDDYLKLLFIQIAKKDEYNMTMPFHFLGPVDHESHEGNRPINIIWKLRNKIPASILEDTNKITGSIS